MKIRGAGKIARSGLGAMLDGMGELYSHSDSAESFLGNIRAARKILIETRPTAVALPNALAFLDNALDREARAGATKESLRLAAERAIAEFIKRMDESYRRIVDLALPLIPKDSAAITHCHSSVAVAVMRRAAEGGLVRAVYVTETRPVFQGRITAKELQGSGASVKLITDSAAGYYMNDVDIMVVGADAIAMNGDVVNKIGTFPIAVLAKHMGRKVLVAAETYKIATKANAGAEVPIEFRDVEEVYQADSGPETQLEILNPVFDVTPGQFIDFIVTELGVVGEPTSDIPRVAREAGLILDR